MENDELRTKVDELHTAIDENVTLDRKVTSIYVDQLDHCSGGIESNEFTMFLKNELGKESIINELMMNTDISVRLSNFATGHSQITFQFVEE